MNTKYHGRIYFMKHISKNFRHIGAIVFALFVCHSSFAALEQDADGYYLIKSAADLAEYRDAVNGGTQMDGRLAADIDMSSVCGVINGKKVTWVPINRKRLSIKFDGANHTVSNLYISTKNSNQGLLFSADIVRDLTLKNAYVKGADNCSGIVASGYGSARRCLIENCHFDGSVIGMNNVGGITSGVDMVAAHILNCSNSGTVVGANNVGGIAGYTRSAVFINCYNLGRVKAVPNIAEDNELIYEGIAGGLAGTFDVGAFYNCYNYNKISGLSAGNITGQVRSSGKATFSSCFGLEGMATVNDFESGLKIYAASAFRNGTVLNRLNKYIENTPTYDETYFSETIALKTWTQVSDIDDYPRFEDVVLRPRKISIVTYRGDYFGMDVFSESMTLPVCGESVFTYQFSNSFDGKNVTGDTVVIVTKVLKQKFLKKDNEGFYLIGSAKDLGLFRDAVNGGATTIKGRLTDDIDMGDVSSDGKWSPIGLHDLCCGTPFSGVFDGANYSIYNLNVTTDQEFAGLFSSVKDALIENVTVKSSSFTGYYAGSLCAYAESSTFANCGGEASVVGTSADGAAGFIGVAIDCDILNCFNLGDVRGEGKASGFVAVEQENCRFVNCYASCHVSNSSEETGLRSPFVFESMIETLDNCYYDSTLFYSTTGYWGQVNDSVIATTTEFIKTKDFIDMLNHGVDSLNSVQDTIAYRKWVAGQFSGYPKFNATESAAVYDAVNNADNVLSFSAYSSGDMLYVKAKKAGIALLYNRLGQVVMPIRFEEGLTEVPGLPAGVYVIGGKLLLVR